MEFVALPRRSPRFPQSSSESTTSLSSSTTAAANVVRNAIAVASSSSVVNQSVASTYPSSTHDRDHHQQLPEDLSPASVAPVSSNKKRPRLTLDLPNIPNTPTGLSPRDIRALKRRKLLHPGSPTPSAPSSPTKTAINGNAIAGPSSANNTPSPLTSPISAVSTLRSSTPPPPPSIPPLIQPTSANAVRSERRKKAGFESSPLSRNSTTPASNRASPPAPLTRHGYALRSAPTQTAEPSSIRDVKGKGKEKITDSKPATAGSKRRRKENSATVLNGPTNKRLRSNSTPVSLVALSTNALRSRRGIPRPPAPPAPPSSSKGKGRATDLPPASPMVEDFTELPIKRPSMRALRSNSTVSEETTLPLPPTHRRTRSRGSNAEEQTNNVQRISPVTKVRGRGRGGKARIGTSPRGRKRVDIIEASPKRSQESDKSVQDVPELSLNEGFSPSLASGPTLVSPKEAGPSRPRTPDMTASSPTAASPVDSLPALTPSPILPSTVIVPTRPSTPEPMVISSDSPQESDEARSTLFAPFKQADAPSSPERAPASPIVAAISPPPTSPPLLTSPTPIPSTSATAFTAQDVVDSTLPATQRPPLRLRIPGEVTDSAPLTNDQAFQANTSTMSNQQQPLPEDLNALSFSLEQPSLPQTSSTQMIQEPTQVAMSLPMEQASVSQQMVYQQTSSGGYVEQDSSMYQQPLGQDQYTMDEAYQQQLAQQQHQMAQQQQVHPVQRRPTAPGLWEVACKIRVCELERRYSWITIRDLVTQEAAEYAMRHGSPRSWWRVTHPPQQQPSSRTSSPSSVSEELPTMSMSVVDDAPKPSTPLPDHPEEDDGEDWSDYESEFSDVESEGKISRESSKGNSPIDPGVEARSDKSVSPSSSPRRRKRRAVVSAEATLNINGAEAPTPPAFNLPTPRESLIANDEAAKQRRRSWPGDFNYEEDMDMDMDDDDDDSDDEEDEDADAEGEIDPDAWHDPSFHVVAQPVEVDEDDNEDKENAGVPAKDAQEMEPPAAESGKKRKRMKTPAVEVGGTMSAFYVPPLPPSPPTTTVTLPSPPPPVHQELSPGLDAPSGGENSDGNIGMPHQEPSDMEYFAPVTSDVSNLSPTSPSSPVSYNSAYDPNAQAPENPSPEMFSQPSSAMSPSAYIPNMGMMYESTLPVPAPRLDTIRVHALRSVEVGRVVVGKGTPVDRRRVTAWANAGSPVREALQLDDIDGDDRVGFFRAVISKDDRRKNVGSSPGSETDFISDMATPIATGATDVNMGGPSHTHPPLSFDPAMWDPFLFDPLKSTTGCQIGLPADVSSATSNVINSNIRSEPERPFEPAPPPLPPSPSTPLSTPPASPLSTTPLSSPAVLGFSSADGGMYYSNSSAPSTSGSDFHGLPMSTPGMHINSAAAVADFGIGMFGMGFNMGVGVGVGIGIAVGAAGVASGMVNIPPPPTQAPMPPPSPGTISGWVPPPPTSDYDQQSQLQQGAFGMPMPGDIFGEHSGSYNGFGTGGSSTLSFALG